MIKIAATRGQDGGEKTTEVDVSGNNKVIGLGVKEVLVTAEQLTSVFALHVRPGPLKNKIK